MLAVFSWGLRYKLSLYGSASVRQHTPAAKVLSQRERATQVSGSHRLLNGPMRTPAGNGHAFAAEAAAVPIRVVPAAVRLDIPPLRVQVAAPVGRGPSAPRAPPFWN